MDLPQLRRAASHENQLEVFEVTLFWNANDRQPKLGCFQRYYNKHRVHTGLGDQTPADMAGEPRPQAARLTPFNGSSHCGGLIALPSAA